MVDLLGFGQCTIVGQITFRFISPKREGESEIETEEFEFRQEKISEPYFKN